MIGIKIRKLAYCLNLNDADRALLAKKTKKLIHEEFSLEEVINKQVEVYGWLCGGQKPDFMVNP